jgi:hypothetical protein
LQNKQWNRGIDLVQSEKALNQAVRDMVHRMFGGQSEGLVMILIA